MQDKKGKVSSSPFLDQKIRLIQTDLQFHTFHTWIQKVESYFRNRLAFVIYKIQLLLVKQPHFFSIKNSLHKCTGCKLQFQIFLVEGCVTLSPFGPFGPGVPFLPAFPLLP